MSHTALSKSASHLLNHASDIYNLPLVAFSECGVTKSGHDSAEQYPCTGTSQLQLQLDFVSHLMRIGERLSQLPTKELRGMLNFKIQFMLNAVTWCLETLLT